MIQINNVRFYSNGLVVNSRNRQTIIYLIITQVPVIITTILAGTQLIMFDINILPICCLSILLLSHFITLCLTIFKDPGYLPTFEVQQQFNEVIMKLLAQNIKKTEQISDSEITSEQIAKMNNNYQTQLYQDMYHQAYQEEQNIVVKDNELVLTRCSECKQMQGLRMQHSPYSGICCRRYDHFSKLFGVDIGLRNQYYYIITLIIVSLQQFVSLIYCVVMIIFMLLRLAYCQTADNIFIDNGQFFCITLSQYEQKYHFIDQGSSIMTLVLSIINGVIHGIMVYFSILFLQVQKQRLITGARKIDAEITFNQNIIFTYINGTRAMRHLHHNAKKLSLMHLYLKNCNKLIYTLKHNPSITTYEQLQTIVESSQGYLDKLIAKSIKKQFRKQIKQAKKEESLEVNIKQYTALQTATQFGCFQIALEQSKDAIHLTKFEYDVLLYNASNAFGRDGIYKPIKSKFVRWME